MQLRILFIHKISKVPLKTLELIRERVRQAQQTNAASATTAESHIKGTTTTLELYTGLKGKTTVRFLSIRLIVDKKLTKNMNKLKSQRNLVVIPTDDGRKPAVII